MLLAAYLDLVAGALAAKNGESLAELLSVSRGRAPVELASLSVDHIASICGSKLGRFPAFLDVVAGLVLARKHLADGAFGEAYTCQIGSVIKFMEIFRGETNWVVPFLHVLTLDTRLIAARVRPVVYG
jgi:hypothetical protein